MGEGKAKDVVGIPDICSGDVGICIQATPDKFCKKIDKVERLFVRLKRGPHLRGQPLYSFAIICMLVPQWLIPDGVALGLVIKRLDY